MRPQEFKELGVKMFIEGDLIEGIQQQDREKTGFFDLIQNAAEFILTFAVTLQGKATFLSISNDCRTHFVEEVLTSFVQIIAQVQQDEEVVIQVKWKLSLYF